MTREDFELITTAILTAVATLDGWQDPRPAGTIGTNDNHWTPSRQLLAEAKRELQSYNFIVLSKREQI
jgi:hypothetical protein